jgi:SAM-dependent methyltransferase
MNVFEHNRRAWDAESRSGSPWCEPVDAETIARARNGEWSVVLTPHKPVPRSWFGGDMAGRRVLCLASGGGQQAPVLAAAGAVVTSFDASPEQLAKDRAVANREGLDLRCIEGDMADLSALPDAGFDLIFHPCANVFVPNLEPVWRECARVLRSGGALLAGFMNPAYFLFDHDEAQASGELRVVFVQPYSDLSRSPGQQRALQDDALLFGHSLEQQIGGQMKAGFSLNGLYEDDWSAEATPLDRFMTTSIATRAIKRTGAA